MTRRFNTTGVCYPDEHYMVDLPARLIRIKKIVLPIISFFGFFVPVACVLSR